MQLIDGVKQWNVSAQGRQESKEQHLLAIGNQPARQCLGTGDVDTPFSPICRNGFQVAEAREDRISGFGAKSAALEYATRGIRINDVCPGMIQTPMSDKMIAEGQGEELDKMLNTFVPMRRLGRPEEIADAVLWLCSSAASYVTGQSISVDGGYVMR